MDDAGAHEAAPDEVAFSLAWWRDGDWLQGLVEAVNISQKIVRLSGKPDVKPLDADGHPLPPDSVVTLEFMHPGYALLAPGERARAQVTWGGGWDGELDGERWAVHWAGGTAIVPAAVTARPGGGDHATDVGTWFVRVQ